MTKMIFFFHSRKLQTLIPLIKESWCVYSFNAMAICFGFLPEYIEMLPVFAVGPSKTRVCELSSDIIPRSPVEMC